ncbi:GlsB/YeaQ/YmgE family stress response membrane protein [Mycobacterium sp.]|jgi:uncharacterized membrane protein YeaQ/YmgE (transglycosylase-associated protein family)|uniref:GlsB/YeaQ/YmgE family stress response membrane protein n=1 Tax=Mycobacterium sp. TaxID=1785 RepID=UPI002D41D6F4|nr:GlsB/YeaQ/YmgE family stress response membrane protein [Mycobacterium sp.]HZA09639.1 GlsB/YeaQ/YmgE family stress response membrane protein [Mycobacterium sp.]
MDTTSATEFLALNLDGKTGIGWIGYIIIGGIAGWIASKIMGTDKQMGILLNIVVGVVGAFVAGLVLNLVGVDVNSGGYWFTFFIALAGSVVLLWLVKVFRRA